MQVPTEILECVGFVCCDTRADGFKTIGTVFFLAIGLPGINLETGAFATYAITARHVVEYVKNHSKDGMVIMRLNARSGGPQNIGLDHTLWQMHPTKNSDVAIVRINFDYARFQHQAVGEYVLLHPETIKEHGIGPGDDLFFPGLFVEHPGESKNVPIIRTGSIAAMPGEPIQTAKQGKLTAYLIEARSVGGLSGSPVFLHLDGPRAMRTKTGGWNTLYLLGVVQGHYDVKPEADVSEDDYLLDRRTRWVNMGIAIVTPIADVIDILQAPRNLEDRASGARQYINSMPAPPTAG